MLRYLDWPEINNYNLSSRDVHLWCIELPPLNSKPKYEQLQSIRAERQKILKEILAKYIGHRHFNISQNPKGKPYLNAHSLSFNLTHSNQLMLIAIHSNEPLGIDLEFIKNRDAQQFSERFWGKDFYHAELESQPSYLKNIAFYQAWTQTEAWIKFHGETVFNHQVFTPKNLLSKIPFEINNKLFINFMPKINFCATLCCSAQVTHLFIKKLNFDITE